MKSEVKGIAAHNAREIRKTGGGEADLMDLDEVNETVEQMIPAVSIEGVPAALDLHDGK